MRSTLEQPITLPRCYGAVDLKVRSYKFQLQSFYILKLIFVGGLDPVMKAYNQSIHIDKAFWKQDIAGSIAWARANKNVGILTESEFEEIARGFAIVAQEWESNTFKIDPDLDEDIYTANERRLGEVIGMDTAGKLHTGRSRNDQSSNNARLWLRDNLEPVSKWLKEFLDTLISRAEFDIDHLMPGYTHLQRAQPVRWSHFLLNHATAFAADLQRLNEVLPRINSSPYGSGALAGNAFGVDRQAIADELGFASLAPNSMRVAGDRDFSVEFLQWAAMLMMHLSRYAEDLVIYGTAEFGFIQLADAYCTGSSLMPQKKNSDSLELIRGRSGRVFGNMTAMMYSVKGLPSTYNKDLGGSHEAMMDATKTVGESLQVATGVLATLSIFPEKMIAALTPDMLATDLAEYLVRKGVPFRETHHIAGRVVKLAETAKLPMDRLSFKQIQEVDSRFSEDVMECFNYEKSVESHNVQGGTSRSSVLQQITDLRSMIAAL